MWPRLLPFGHHWANPAVTDAPQTAEMVAEGEGPTSFVKTAEIEAMDPLGGETLKCTTSLNWLPNVRDSSL